jgi:hypothetical protein
MFMTKHSAQIPLEMIFFLLFFEKQYTISMHIEQNSLLCTNYAQMIFI